MKYLNDQAIQHRYQQAKQQYALFGVDTEGVAIGCADLAPSHTHIKWKRGKTI